MYIYCQVQNTRFVNLAMNTNTEQKGIYAAVNKFAHINASVSLLIKSEIDAIMYLFYTLAIFAGLVLLITFAIIKRVAIATQIIKITSTACLRMP